MPSKKATAGLPFLYAASLDAHFGQPEQNFSRKVLRTALIQALEDPFLLTCDRFQPSHPIMLLHISEITKHLQTQAPLHCLIFASHSPLALPTRTPRPPHPFMLVHLGRISTHLKTQAHLHCPKSCSPAPLSPCSHLAKPTVRLILICVSVIATDLQSTSQPLRSMF